MKNIVLALALCTLSATALADPTNPASDETRIANDDAQAFELSTVESGMIPDEVSNEEFLAAPRPVETRIPVGRRHWTCIAADRIGHRFYGYSFVPGLARANALRACNRSFLPPRGLYKGCHIVRCIPR